MKRVLLNTVKAIAGVAAVVFWFCPLRTATQVLIFLASIAVLLICAALSSNLDDQTNTGYSPEKPIDWSAPGNAPSISDERK
jgi:hypothetical protein